MDEIDEIIRGKKNEASQSAAFATEAHTQSQHSNSIPHFPGMSMTQANPYQLFEVNSNSGMYIPAGDDRGASSLYLQNTSFRQSYGFGQVGYEEMTHTRQRSQDNKSYNRQNHHTLGQMAEKVQARAKAVEEQSKAMQEQQEQEPQDQYEDDGELDNNPSNSGAERAGRWTKEEHEIFLNAIKKYGKEWKKVAALIKTRTVVQTRTHAQKYFQKISKTSMGDDLDGAFGLSVEANVKTNKRPRRVIGDNQGKKRRPDIDHEHEHDQEQEQDDSLDEDDGDGDDESESEGGNILPIGPSSALETASYAGPRISIPTAANVAGHFPLPSPAACGSRKYDELAAAQMLAGTSTLDIDGAQMLVGLRSGTFVSGNTGDKSVSGNDRSAPDGTTLPSGLSKSRGFMPLSIINPATIGSYTYEDAPETPWDGELRALGESTVQPKTAVSNTVSPKIWQQPPFEMSDDIKPLHARLKVAVISGDVDSLIAGMKAIEETINTTSALHGGRSIASVAAIVNHREPSARSMSLLMFACELDPTKYKESQVLQLSVTLVEHGASVLDCDALGWSSLHRVARFGYASVGHFLLSKGCYVNAIGPNGDAATHIAAKAGQEKFLQMLCSLGANPHIRNVQGQAAIDLVAIDIIVNPKAPAGGSSARPTDRHHEYNEYLASRSHLRQVLLQAEPRLRTLVLYHEDCLAHTARQPTDWEQPDRLREIMRGVNDTNAFQSYEVEVSSAFKKAGVEILSRAHSAEYITFVNDISKHVQDDHLEADSKGLPKPPPLPFTPQVQKFIKHFNGDELKSAESCDTAFSAGTLRAARRAAGAVAHAIDMILLGRYRNAFCIVRPPGHHAGYSGLLDGGKSCGFCIFNNVGAGALHALEFHKIERVAIIDLDIHHGNGTEDIVRRYGQPSRLFFFSLHLFDKNTTGDSAGYEFFPGSGAADDTTHNIINVPIPPIWSTTHANAGVHHGTRASKSTSEAPPPMLVGREAYRQAISQRLLPSLRAFNPDLILLSTGFDAAQGDLGNVRYFTPSTGSGTGNANAHPVRERGMDLMPADFEWVTTEVLRVADLCCAGRVVSVLEGGYGEYAKQSKSSGRSKTNQMTAPDKDKDKESVGAESSVASITGTPTTTTTTAAAAAEDSLLDRNVLVTAAVSHLRRLIDPYGPSTHALKQQQMGRGYRARSNSESSVEVAQALSAQPLTDTTAFASVGSAAIPL